MLARIEARGFRNLQPLALDLDGGSHLILGDNGAGKTSLLEAVYLLATTRSFRTPRVVDCTHHGGDGFFLKGELASRAFLEVSWMKGDRTRSVNGDRTSLADHLSALPVIAWTASDGQMLTGPPAERRRFLDRGVIGQRPSALAVISRYRQVLEEKRRLLQNGSTRDELMVWNQMQAQAAASLATLRRAYVDRLRTTLADVLTQSDLGLAEIEVNYKPSPRRALEGADSILQSLDEAVEREVAARQVLMGCHRDDMEVTWDGHSIRRVASAGERKALGLALLAAHGRVLEGDGVVPIYLLDDADTELDAERLRRLWKVFGAAGQLLATSNRPSVWGDLGIDRRLRCNDGVVTVEATA